MSSDEDKWLDQWAEQIMKLPGMKTERESYALVEGDTFNGDEVFIKFMSHGGVTDDENGQTLDALLEQAQVKHDYFDGRKFFIEAADLREFLDSQLS